MRVKICGLNIARDVQLCIDLKVNFLGFVFYKKSPRNTDLKDLNKLGKFNSSNTLGELLFCLREPIFPRSLSICAGIK